MEGRYKHSIGHGLFEDIANLAKQHSIDTTETVYMEVCDDEPVDLRACTI